MEDSMLEGKVVVAMSGGVDSSVAALLLAEQGRDVVGVSMQVWDYRNHGGCSSRATCCAPSDFADARSVAGKLGIPYYVFDFEEKFHEKVISKFLKTYENGETPNPCVDCNNEVKFRELRGRALSLGCVSVATGHYVSLKKESDGYHLYRGADDRKDQSYFLYGLLQEELAQTLFPLGELTKGEVRQLARDAGIKTADKPESQDICFVSGPLSEFVGSRLGDAKRPGVFVNREGAVLGSHDGIHQFTVGQRKGLGISGQDNPLYVIDIDRESAEVLVGPREDLEVPGFSVGALNWVHPSYAQTQGPTEEIEVVVQVRHKHRGVRAKLVMEGEIAKLHFMDEWTSPAPGQAGVFYDIHNKELLGGGRILAGCTNRPSLQILQEESRW